MNTNATNSLEALIEQYLSEKLISGNYCVAETALHHKHLIGGVNPLHYFGFVRFLKNRGIPHPSSWELSVYWITEYHEFLFQYVGELDRHASLQALKLFWRWAGQHSYIREAKEPVVFSFDKARPSFRITVKIADYEDVPDLGS